MRYVCIANNLNEYYDLLQNMQCRGSLGLTTKITKLSKGSTRKFKTRRSQSSFSSASDVFADNESTKGQADLSGNGMKLKSEKNLDGSQRVRKPRKAGSLCKMSAWRHYELKVYLPVVTIRR